ncbi:MAG: hypothetical protein ABIP50_03225 [Candidatus Saccharimonadales bacterium]
MTLDTVFEDSPLSLNIIKKRLKVTTLEELMLYTPMMIMNTSGVGSPIAAYIRGRFTELNWAHHAHLRLRDNTESVLDFIDTMYHALINAPLVVLNFSLDHTGSIIHKPLELVQMFLEVKPDAVVLDLDDLDDFLTASNCPKSFITDLSKRMIEWKLQGPSAG